MVKRGIPGQLRTRRRGERESEWESDEKDCAGATKSQKEKKEQRRGHI